MDRLMIYYVKQAVGVKYRAGSPLTLPVITMSPRILEFSLKTFQTFIQEETNFKCCVTYVLLSKASADFDIWSS